MLGTINPVKEMIAYAHSKGVPVLIDGAQAAPHLRIDVRDLDADFYAFSSHKMYGPCGIGVLYGKKKWLQEMPPYQGGGEMIDHVSFSGTTFAELPFKFEAGTPDFIDIAALSQALDFIDRVGLKEMEEHEISLLRRAEAGLRDIGHITIYGTSDHKGPVLSFLVDGQHPYDVGVLLDQMGVAVRTTVPSPLWSASAFPAPYAPPSPSTTPQPKSTPSSPPSAASPPSSTPDPSFLQSPIASTPIPWMAISSFTHNLCSDTEPCPVFQGATPGRPPVYVDGAVGGLGGREAIRSFRRGWAAPCWRRLRGR